MPTDPNNRALGVDVSRWQKLVDWAAVKADGITFAFCKATESTNVVDPFLDENWAGMKAAGVIRGVYHFFRPAQDARAQAAHFAKSVPLEAGDLPPVADIEAHDNMDNLSLIKRAEIFLLEVERLTGRKPILYTGAGFWNGHMVDRAGNPPPWAANYALWVANYTAAAQPLVPKGWKTWTFWQYTDRGSVKGVATPVDTNRFSGTEAELRQWLGLEVASPKPSAEPAIKLKNQDVINVFALAFGQGFYNRIERAGLTSIAIPKANRELPYMGPSISEMNLTEEEKAALRAALMKHKERQTVTYLQWDHHALPGLHGPADPGGGWVPEAYEVVRKTKVAAIKVLAPDVKAEEVAELRKINPNMFIMARLFNAQLQNPQGGGTPEGAGRWFANEVADPGDGNNPMTRAYNSGIRYFEVHNEVNLTVEGCGVNWRNGAEFARFFNAVVEVLKPRFPEAKFGFPGLSPGPVFNVRPIDMWEFLDQAKAATDRADFMCCHCYWGGDGSDYTVAVKDLRRFCDKYPSKLVVCSEFSNNHRDVSRDAKAEQIAKFFTAIEALPSNLGAAFIYVLSWRDDHNNEGFLKLTEDKARWDRTPMADKLGGLHPF